jgi:hypothetical protein
MPAADFRYGKDGIASPFYRIDVSREDSLMPYAEIVFHGYMDDMKLYKLIFRPVVSDGDECLGCVRLNYGFGEVRFAFFETGPRAE